MLNIKLSGKDITTFVPAPGQNFSPVFCAHSFAETVLSAALLLFRLKCSFGHIDKQQNNKFDLL
jgi:hypothetical protein